VLFRSGRWNRAVTFISDLIFSFLVLLILVFFFRKANFMEFRMYLFLASLLGLALYLLVLSNRAKVLISYFLAFVRQIGRGTAYGVKTFFYTSNAFWRLVLGIPYGVLRWVGLLIFRFGEAVVFRFTRRLQRPGHFLDKRAVRKRERNADREARRAVKLEGYEHRQAADGADYKASYGATCEAGQGATRKARRATRRSNRKARKG
jgi:hypothetical protein